MPDTQWFSDASGGIDGEDSGDNIWGARAPDHLDAKHERTRQQRTEAVKRWVEYIKAEPPAKWGPQQNTIVDEQLEAAQSVQTSTAHQQHVKDVAEEIAGARDDSDRERQ